MDEATTTTSNLKAAVAATNDSASLSLAFTAIALLLSAFKLLHMTFKDHVHIFNKSRRRISGGGGGTASRGTRDRRQLTEKDVPGPISFPLIGSQWLYWQGVGPYSQHKYHESNQHKYMKYGAVVREEVVFNFKILHLFDKADILKVVNYNSEFPQRPPNAADVYYRLSRPNLYSNLGMVNENGPEWLRIRKQLTPPLTKRTTLVNYAPLMNTIGEDFLHLIERESSDEGDGNGRLVSDIRDLVYRASLEVVCAVALERRLGFLSPPEVELEEDCRLIFESIHGYQAASDQAMYGLPWWQFLPNGFSSVFTNLVHHKDNLFKLIGNMVDQTLERNADSVASEDECSSSKSILEQLVSNEAIGLSEVKSSVVDYITAGVDTIGNTMVFALALLAKHQNAQTRLQKELDQFFNAATDNSTLFPEAIDKMRYLKACLLESFRMYPTASQLARILEQETAVTGGFVLSKGTLVLCHHRVAAMQPQNFTRPDEFVPERWLSEERDPGWNHEPGLVIPFGVGRRICPGKRLAEQELSILIAKLFHSHDLRLQGNLDADFNFLLVPSNDFQIIIHDRHRSA